MAYNRDYICKCLCDMYLCILQTMHKFIRTEPLETLLLSNAKAVYVHFPEGKETYLYSTIEVCYEYDISIKINSVYSCIEGYVDGDDVCTVLLPDYLNALLIEISDRLWKKAKDEGRLTMLEQDETGLFVCDILA